MPWVGIKHRPERGGAELWVPPDGSAVLADHGARLGYPAMFEDTFQLREYAPLEPFTAGGIEMLAAPMPHYRMPCHALRVKADGRSFVYSADTGPTPALADLARDADLFICEATLETGADDGDIRGHRAPTKRSRRPAKPVSDTSCSRTGRPSCRCRTGSSSPTTGSSSRSDLPPTRGPGG